MVAGNVFLVGMMGAGKSTVGKALARRLGRAFVDCDREIVERTGVPIATIFEIEGEPGFRKREAAMIAELARRQGIVVATGGGAVLAEENRRLMRESGTVVQLHASLDHLHERTRRDISRPLLAKGDRRPTLAALLEARDPLQREAAHQLDVLAPATGFRVDRFMRPMQVFGRGGVALDEVWANGPTAYMAITAPEFPNLFMLNGPNGPVGNFSLIEVAELQFGYILQLIERVRSGACREVTVSQAAMERYDVERRQAARSTIWQSGCRSWYLGADGVPAVWPWTFDRLRQEMAHPRFEHLELR